MDLITAAVGSVSVGRANGRRIAESGPYGLRLPVMPVLGFHVMLSGDGWLITERSAPAAVRRGDIVFVAAGAAHGIAREPCTLAELPPAAMGETPPAAPADFEFLCGTYPLPGGRLPALLRHLPEVVAFTPDYDDDPHLRAVVEMLGADYAREGPGSGAARGALIDLMLVHILRHLQRRWPFSDEPGVAEALRAMHEQPARPWTVQQLSDLAGLSRSAFTRRFQAVTGAPPMAYLTDRRLAAGERLLRETREPLTAVARRTGYATPFAFTAAFRRKYGMPPGRYRTERG
ncbi:helix-turn-helix transcriptional regulator [Catenuloplanes atrovinosus]|uniref:AraC-like DNA-binding protein n=1 Tax=Catenuloplanes atrovinosus TaxID=137266 RepID=A0AAE4CAH5_9ACTN|nr:AraC family transcriptional regulator [Catenuloplanes atrovinosus]MDR7277063.1 AraC-like DNA-binding protein [Catenuloplanes atrovinosus]